MRSSRNSFIAIVIIKRFFNIELPDGSGVYRGSRGLSGAGGSVLAAAG
jgi:hypothetical protein